MTVPAQLIIAAVLAATAVIYGTDVINARHLEKRAR